MNDRHVLENKKPDENIKIKTYKVPIHLVNKLNSSDRLLSSDQTSD